MDRVPRGSRLAHPLSIHVHRMARWAQWLFVLVVAPVAHAAPGGDAFFELSGGFKSGDFGTAVRSDLTYVAPAAGYVTPDYDLNATIPYLRLTTEDSATSSSESGLGDIVARAGRVLLPEAVGDFSVYGALALKLPTADETRGLGTGETDLGAFLSARRPLGKLRLNLQTGYIKSGLTQMEGLRGVFLYGAGLSAVADRTHWQVSLDGRTSLVHGARAPLEISAGALHALGGRYFAKVSAFAGLNDGGPAFGVGTGLVWVF